MEPIQGLHHVTAAAGDPQQNVDFYRNVLGQRLVKRTVNFDSPDTYHLYFGDEAGTPGSILTFFAWPDMPRGVRGNGETNAVAYGVPAGSLDFWQTHLRQSGLKPGPIEKRFGEQVLPFEDPDGMHVELVESSSAAPVDYWENGPIPQNRALLGFHSVTLWVEQVDLTAELLTRHMGYAARGQEGDRYRFVGDPSVPGHLLDLIHRPGGRRADFGVGSIHHIAFRVPTDEKQLAYQNAIRQAGLRVTQVMDRNYFHSIYFRERNGVLFEIATDTPGFAVDEPVHSLGESLKLPEWYEPDRSAIEQRLPPVTLKSFEKVPA